MIESNVAQNSGRSPLLLQAKRFIADKALMQYWPWAVGTLVAILVVWNAISHMAPFYHAANNHEFSIYYINADIDRWQITRHIAAVHSFGQTFRWWHGPWCGWGAYWRPLTSLGFWLEYKLFGPDRQDLWQIATFSFHLLFTVVLGFFAYRFTNRIGVALLAVFLFAGTRDIWPIPSLLGMLSEHAQAPLLSVPADVALQNWIDQPEMWFATFALLALLLAMRSRWWLSLGCVALSIMFKEPGWFTLPMILIFLVLSRRLREVPPSVYLGIGIVCGVLIAIRALSGHAVLVEHMTWSNKSWPLRYSGDVLGYPWGLILSLQITPLLAGAGAGLIAIKLRGPLWIKTLAIIAAIGIIACVDGVLKGCGAMVSLELLLDPSFQLPAVVACFAYFFVAYYGWRSPEVRKQFFLLFPLILIAAIPQAVDLQDGSDHIDYFPLAFQSLLIAIVIAGAWRGWIGRSILKVGKMAERP